MSHIDFSVTNTTINSLLDINDKQYLKENTLVFNIPEKKYYGNIFSSYNYANILFINDNKDIIPLSYGISNINSSFSINSSYQYFINIDNNTIIEKNKKLYGSYEHIPIAKDNIQGRFSYNAYSLTTIDKIVNYNPKKLLTINSNIIDRIDNINEFLSSTYILQKLGIYYTYLSKYEQINNRYSKPIFIYQDQQDIQLNETSIIYKDKQNIYDLKNNELYIIEEDINQFNIILTFTYKYESTQNIDYIQYKELIDNFISNSNISYDSLILDFNKDKSFIFDIKKINYEFNSETNNILITSQVKYNIWFDIKINGIGKTNIQINDFKINLYQITQLNPLDKIGEILYFDKYVGFNFDKIGDNIGLCLYPRNFFNNDNQVIHEDYTEDIENQQYNYSYTSLKNIENNLINYKKPIYIRLKNNQIETINISTENINNIEYLRHNNLSIYNYSEEDTNISYIYEYKELQRTSTSFTNLSYYNTTLVLDPYYIDNKYLNNSLYSSEKLYTSWKTPKNSNCYVSPYIATVNNLFRYFYCPTSVNIINNIFNLEYNNLIKNKKDEYDIKLYLPSIYDLCVFNGFNFQKFLDNKNITELSSKVFLKKDNDIYNYKLGLNNRFILNNNTDLTSIMMFTVPDIIILYSDQYYLLYDSIKQYYIIDYLSFSFNILLNIQIFGQNTYNILNSDILFKINYDKNNKHYEKLIHNYQLTDDNDIIEIDSNSFITDKQLSFNIYNYDVNENIITIYYQDSNIDLNTENINGKKYRTLCEIHIKK